MMRATVQWKEVTVGDHVVIDDSRYRVHHLVADYCSFLCEHSVAVNMEDVSTMQLTTDVYPASDTVTVVAV